MRVIKTFSTCTFKVGLLGLALPLAGLLSGCVKPEPKPGVLRSSVFPADPAQRVQQISVNRSAYQGALGNEGALRRLRLVEVFRSQKSDVTAPEWRLFDVAPGSALDVLALEEGDIILAANDYIIYDGALFKAYLMMLQNQKDASILLRRQGKEIKYEYMFQ